jgi:hypothetical protein
MQFLNTLPATCNQCFEIKSNFKISNNLNWQELNSHSQYPNLICDQHKMNESNFEPNIIVMYKEEKTQRGEFTRYLLTDFCESENSRNKFSFDYTDNKKVPGLFVKHNKRLTENCKFQLKKLEEVEDFHLPLINQFLKLICCNTKESFINTTFILQDEDSITLVIK